MQEDLKRSTSLKSRRHQSSNMSSTEFIIEPQKEDDIKILENGMQDLSDSNVYISFQPNKTSNSRINSSGQIINLLPIDQINGSSKFHPLIAGEREYDLDDITEQKKKLFDAREHQSLMEIPQREIQSVQSPSQHIQTPSNKEYSGKQDVASKRGGGSSVHLNIDVKGFEDRQKRQSILKQKLSEMQDSSIELSLKGNSYDLQSQMAKAGSQFDSRDDSKYLHNANNNANHSSQFNINPLLQQQILPTQIPQYQQRNFNSISSYGQNFPNNFQIINQAPSSFGFGNPVNQNNSGSSGSNNLLIKSNMPSIIFHQNQENQQMQSEQNNNSHNNNLITKNNNNNISNLNINASPKSKDKNDNFNLKYNSSTPGYNSNYDTNKTNYISRRNNMRNNNQFPTNFKFTKYNLIDYFLGKLKRSTVLLRQPSDLTYKHFQMINDISFQIDSILFIKNNPIFWFIRRYIISYFDWCLQIPMNNPSSLLISVNSIIQSVAIILFLLISSLRITFTTDLKSGYFSPIFLLLFILDTLVYLNTTTVTETDEKKIIMLNSRMLNLLAYLKSYLLFDIGAFIYLCFDSRKYLIESSESYLILNLLCYLKCITLIRHLRLIYDFGRTSLLFITSLSLVNVLLIFSAVIHVIALCWFRIVVENSESDWLVKQGIVNSEWQIKYLQSVQWSICIISLTNVQYANSNSEIIFSCAALVIGLVTIGMCFFWVKNILHYAFKSWNIYFSNLQPLNISKHINQDLKAQILYSLRQNSQLHQKQYLEQNENRIMQSLSHQIRASIEQSSKRWIISQIELLNQNFSTSTLSTLLDCVQIESFKPGQVIFNENNVFESSLFFIIKGSVGVYQGTDQEGINLKYVHSLKEGESFGQMSFLSGMSRQVSNVSLEFVRVGKIKRTSMLEVIKNQQEDLESFCMLKDLVNMYNDTISVEIDCYSCGKCDHTLKECPLTHLKFDKVKIVHRHIYNADMIRNPAVKRRGPSRVKGAYLMLEEAERVQEMLREDSQCYQKLDELIQQLNLCNDEDNYDDYEEDDEEDDDDDEDQNNEQKKQKIQLDKSSNQKFKDETEEHDKRVLGENISKNSTDQEEEGFRIQQQQLFKHIRSTITSNSHQNNNLNSLNAINNPNFALGSSGSVNKPEIISNSNASNNNNNNALHTDNSSQFSKQNVKSIRKGSSSSQVGVEGVINNNNNIKEKKEGTYNTMQTDQQFQSQEFFLQDSNSYQNNNNNNNYQGIGNVNILNSLINLHNFQTMGNNTASITNPNLSVYNNNNPNSNYNVSNHPSNSNHNNPSNSIHNNPSNSIHNPNSNSIHNNPTNSIHNNPSNSTHNPSQPSPIAPLSGDQRKIIVNEQLQQGHLNLDSSQRLTNKRLTIQTAPQVYSRTKSYASRKSQVKNGSPPEQQMQQQMTQLQTDKSDKNTGFQDMILDPSMIKEFYQDYTMSSKRSKKYLKFADESLMKQSIETGLKNNPPTNSSLQLSPYQDNLDSLSSKENSNYQTGSQLLPNFIIQQFQNILLKFQLMFRQFMQVQRDKSLQNSLEKLNGDKMTSDYVIQQPIIASNKSISDQERNTIQNHLSNLNALKQEPNGFMYKKYMSSNSNSAEEWNLDKIKNYQVYFPYNNFEQIYPQIQLYQQIRDRQKKFKKYVILKKPTVNPLLLLQSVITNNNNKRAIKIILIKVQKHQNHHKLFIKLYYHNIYRVNNQFLPNSLSKALNLDILSLMELLSTKDIIKIECSKQINQYENMLSIIFEIFLLDVEKIYNNSKRVIYFSNFFINFSFKLE